VPEGDLRGLMLGVPGDGRIVLNIFYITFLALLVWRCTAAVTPIIQEGCSLNHSITHSLDRLLACQSPLLTQHYPTTLSSSPHTERDNGTKEVCRKEGRCSRERWRDGAFVTHSLNRSITQSLNQSLTHSITRSLIH
jgi:hypothetical protein